MSELSPRPICPDCRRPLGVCFCQHITRLPTRTRILLLQHVRERRVGIGTARLAHLALPGSLLRVGVDFAGDEVVQAALADPTPPYLLFPGPGARPVEELPRDRAITLCVLDGTWWQARKLLRSNPALAALPRIAFRPRRPSGYLIRRQPADFCVSTIEALAEVLEAIEPDGARFQRLLDPFAAMVERQRRFETEVHARRHLRPARLGPSRSAAARARLAARLAAAWPHLLCVQGEANAWPRRHPEHQPPESVHWLAHRPSTGETFTTVIAPRRPLAPATPRHVDLPAAVLAAGATAEGWRQAWAAFTRPGDILAVWGTFYRDLAAGEALALPPDTLDLRALARQIPGEGSGEIEACLAAHGAAPAPLALPGRGGRRLAQLVGLVAKLMSNRDERAGH